MILVAVPFAAFAQAPDLSNYHLTFDQNVGANGVDAGPAGTAGAAWETWVA